VRLHHGWAYESHAEGIERGGGIVATPDMDGRGLDYGHFAVAVSQWKRSDGDSRAIGPPAALPSQIATKRVHMALRYYQVEVRCEGAQPWAVEFDAGRQEADGAREEDHADIDEPPLDARHDADDGVAIPDGRRGGIARLLFEGAWSDESGEKVGEIRLTIRGGAGEAPSSGSHSSAAPRRPLAASPR